MIKGDTETLNPAYIETPRKDLFTSLLTQRIEICLYLVPPSVKHTFFSNLTPWLFSNAFCFASSSKTGLEHIWNNVSFSEFAKLRAFRACVLRAQVLYASTYLRVFEFYVATCIYNWYVFVSSYFKLCAYVPSVFTCLHALKN